MVMFVTKACIEKVNRYLHFISYFNKFLVIS